MNSQAGQVCIIIDLMRALWRVNLMLTYNHQLPKRGKHECSEGPDSDCFYMHSSHHSFIKVYTKVFYVIYKGNFLSSQALTSFCLWHKQMA